MEERNEIYDEVTEVSTVEENEAGSNGFGKGIALGVIVSGVGYGMYKGGKALWKKFKNRKSKTADDAIEEVESEVEEEDEE